MANQYRPPSKADVETANSFMDSMMGKASPEVVTAPVEEERPPAFGPDGTPTENVRAPNPVPQEAQKPPPPPAPPEQASDPIPMPGQTVPAIPKEDGERRIAQMGEFTTDYKKLFKPSDLELPRLAITQGNTLADKRGDTANGKWFVAGYPGRDTITIESEGAGIRRDLGYFDKSNNYIQLCYSADSFTGVGDPGGDCSTCPFAEFTDDPVSGERRAPKCNYKYEYIVFVKEMDTAAILTFQRTAVPAGRRLNRLLIQTDGKRPVKLGTKPDHGGGQDFFGPTIIGIADKDEGESNLPW